MAASEQVFNIIRRFSSTTERGSIDEAYLDVTEAAKRRLAANANNTEQNNSNSGFSWDRWRYGHIYRKRAEESYTNDINKDDDKLLWVAAQIASEIREAISRELGFESSAGIAHNKLLAKLASSIHKPNQQATVTASGVQEFMKGVPVAKLPKLNTRVGKQGKKLLDNVTGATFAAELIQNYSKQDLVELFRKEVSLEPQYIPEAIAEWLHNACNGNDGDEPVKEKGPPKSIMTSMSLTPINGDLQSVERVLKYLAAEFVQRLEADERDFNRRPNTFHFGYRLINEKEASQSVPMYRVLHSNNNNSNNNKKKMASQGTVATGGGSSGSSNNNAGEYTVTGIANTALGLFKNAMKNKPSWSLRWISVGASSFVNNDKTIVPITSLFKTEKPNNNSNTKPQTNHSSTTARPINSSIQYHESKQPLSPSPPLVSSPLSSPRAQPSKKEEATTIACPVCGTKLDPTDNSHVNSHFVVEDRQQKQQSPAMPATSPSKSRKISNNNSSTNKKKTPTTNNQTPSSSPKKRAASGISTNTTTTSTTTTGAAYKNKTMLDFFAPKKPKTTTTTTSTTSSSAEQQQQ